MENLTLESNVCCVRSLFGEGTVRFRRLLSHEDVYLPPIVVCFGSVQLIFPDALQTHTHTHAAGATQEGPLAGGSVICAISIMEGARGDASAIFPSMCVYITSGVSVSDCNFCSFILRGGA